MNLNKKQFQEVTEHFDLETIDRGNLQCFIRATCRDCGGTFIAEISCLLVEESAHYARCNVVCIKQRRA